MSAPDRIGAWPKSNDPTSGGWDVRAAKVTQYLRADGPTITALLAQNAAMEAQIKGLEGGIEAACNREAETERKLRTALAASETRAEAAETALVAAMDPALTERAGEVLSRLRKADEYEPLGHDGWEAADLITALLAQNAALQWVADEGKRLRAEAEAERDALRAERDAAHALASERSSALLAAEATIATLTEKVEAMRRALKYYKDTFCEGFCGEDCWSDEGHSHPDLQRDCSGCLAASVLIRAARTTENQTNG